MSDLLGRAPWVTAGELNDDQRALRDRIQADWGGGKVGLSPVDERGRLVGPFDLMAASPGVGGAVLATASSFGTAELTVLERELAILVVAVAEQSPFMWEGHVPVAEAAGLPEAATLAIQRGESPELDEPLVAIHRLARGLTSERDLDDETFEGMVAALGWRRVQEVVWLVGLYQALGLAMRVARTPLPRTGEVE